MNFRTARIQEIDAECARLQRSLDTLYAERKKLMMLGKREEYSCSCVRLNSEIGIFDMIEQEESNRNGIGCGLVSETLSALKCCPNCSGTGKPNTRK